MQLHILLKESQILIGNKEQNFRILSRLFCAVPNKNRSNKNRSNNKAKLKAKCKINITPQGGTEQGAAVGGRSECSQATETAKVN